MKKKRSTRKQNAGQQLLYEDALFAEKTANGSSRGYVPSLSLNYAEMKSILDAGQIPVQTRRALKLDVVPGVSV